MWAAHLHLFTVQILWLTADHAESQEPVEQMKIGGRQKYTAPQDPDMTLTLTHCLHSLQEDMYCSECIHAKNSKTEQGANLQNISSRT